MIELEDYFLTKQDFHLLQCHDCNLILTNPYPDESIAGTYYESDKYFSHSEKAQSLTGLVYAIVKSLNIKSKYRLLSKKHKKAKILDIGCGIGDFLLHCKNNGWETFGIESGVEARKIAEQKLKQRIFEPNQITDLETNSFQIVSMWHVLEHIYDINLQIDQIKQLLDDDGQLIIALPNPISYDASYYKEYWAAWDVPRHLFHFKPYVIERFLKQKGFKLDKIKPMYWDAFYVSILSEKYKGKSSITAYVRGVYRGLRSNLRAIKTNEYSSLIYIFSLNETNRKAK